MSVNPASVTNQPAQFAEDNVFVGATAAYQVEGETRTHGKGKVAWDDFLEVQGRFSPDPASDFNNQYPVDLELCEEFGINGIRLSIAWSRIFPNGDEEEPNDAGLAFYEDVFRCCREHGIEPLVTITHFDCPIHLIKEYGGWRNRKLIDFYKNLAITIFTRYKGLVKNWLTFNELNMILHLPFMGDGLV